MLININRIFNLIGIKAIPGVHLVQVSIGSITMIGFLYPNEYTFIFHHRWQLKLNQGFYSR